MVAIVVVRNNALKAANQLADLSLVIAVYASAGDYCAYFLCVKISMHKFHLLY